MSERHTGRQPNNLLSRERLLRGWTQREVGNQVGTDDYTVSRWERGKAVPSPYFRQKLCDLFGKNAQELGLLTIRVDEETHPPTPSNSKLIKHLENDEDSTHYVQDKIALLSYWNVPYQRNAFFTGREQTLQMLHQLLYQPEAAAPLQSYALSGLGGIGKTQTALEYVYQYFQYYSAVFWIGAETAESMIAGFMSIAIVLNFSERQQYDQGQIVDVVIAWLNNHSDWLLIVDNVENLEIVKSLLPTARQGSLLFTTRLHSLGTLAHLIELENMSADEGKRLLLRRAGSVDLQLALQRLTPQDECAISEIAIALDGLPLALDQAGAYIQKTHCSWSDFLHLFHSSPIQMLNERDASVSHPLSVVRTFTLSFEQLQQSYPAAAELLTLCCFLAPEEIPEPLITAPLAHLSLRLQAEVSNPFQFNALLQELLAYSLISRSAQAKTITVHRLIQVVLKQRIPQALQREWNEGVIRMVNQSFALDQDGVNVEQWSWCEQVLPHAFLAVSQQEKEQTPSPERCSLLTKMATYLFQRARYREAEQFYQQALFALGQEHPERARVLTGLANTYQQLGHHQVSVRFYHQAIALIEERLGPNHLEIALPLQGLAFLTFEMANYREAEVLYRRTLHLREQALPPEHPDIATSLNDLAVLCDNQGKYTEAEPLHQRALSLREQAFGPDYLDVSESLNNLAVLYYRQAKYPEAEAYYKRALQIDEQKLGADHPQVGVLLNNLALLYRKQGRYEEAEPLSQRALRIRTQAFGPDHPYTAFFLDHLAALYREQGRYEEAEVSSLQVLRIYEQNVKPDHPVIAKPLSNLALLYCEQGRYQEGEVLARQALAIREQGLEPEHPDIASSLHDLAELYVKQSKYKEAELLYQRALLIRTRVLGPEHPDTASLRARLGTHYDTDRENHNVSL